MNKFELSAPFSLFNGAVVLETSEEFVKFGLRNIDDELLKERLKKSWKNFCDKNSFLSLNCVDSCFFVQISEDELRKAVSFRYGESEEKKDLYENTENCVKKSKVPSDMESGTEMLLDSLLKRAVESEATDIHIEERRVRFRIGGKLHEICELSYERGLELTRRIKVLGKLDVMDSRHGQDGQFVVKNCSESGGRVFVRVSAVPAVSANDDSNFAESIVLRLLDVERVPLSLNRLGFDILQCEKLKKIIQSDNGLFLICGPTGSGKSTTACALITLLNEIYNESKKIITIEDPPEYILDGVTQIHVDESCGVNFETALKYIFRQDPDVIFIGEIRDEKTAKTMMQSSLTGHFVIATVHTSGFYETAQRFKELGINFSELFSVLRGMVVQKLRYEESSFEENFKNKLQMEAKVWDESDIELFSGKSEGTFSDERFGRSKPVKLSSVSTGGFKSWPQKKSAYRDSKSISS